MPVSHLGSAVDGVCDMLEVKCRIAVRMRLAVSWLAGWLADEVVDKCMGYDTLSCWFLRH
jgi:hypothetical protein